FLRYHSSYIDALALFLFQCSRPPRDLHSFPTRRSSDLLLERPGQRGLQLLGATLGGDELGLRGIDVGLDLELTRRAIGPAEHPRSEEHTSELQSRENLVCRLLLEKKKKTQRT